jgi:hypothetical protein
VGTVAVALRRMDAVLEEGVVPLARHGVLRVVVHSAAVQYAAAIQKIAVRQVRHVAEIRAVPKMRSAVLEGIVVPPVRHAVQEVVATMANCIVRIRAAPLELVLRVAKEEAVVPQARLVSLWAISSFAKNRVVQAL